MVPPVLVAVVGFPEASDTLELLDVLFSRYRPHVEIAFTAPEGEAMYHIPALVGCTMRDGCATAYMCHGFSCRPPIVDAEALEEQLQQTLSS